MMACVNTRKLLYVVTYDPNNPKVEVVQSSVAVSEFHKSEKDFFYIQFSDPSSFKIFDIKDLVPEKEFEQIKDPDSNLHLMLDNALEHFLISADTIYEEIVIKHSIPVEKIIFLSAIPIMHDHIKKLSAKYKLPEIKLEWFNLFEWTGRNARLISKDIKTLDKKQKYERPFLCLNRRWRLHRPLMITLLKDRGLIDKGFISLAPSDDGKDWNTVFPRLRAMYQNHSLINPIIERNLDVVNTPPMYLDLEDLVTNRAEPEESINEYYKKTYFSLINETTYHENIPFFSEKIFKAIGMGHPFLVATAANSLQYLRKLGYKTFHPFIDESYDQISDDGKRMLAIVNEAERLCNLDKNEFKSWRAGVEPIVRHNQRLVESKRSVSQRMNY